MDNFLQMILAAVVCTVFMIPVAIALVLATFVAQMFAAVLKPVTDPVEALTEAISGIIRTPLERVPLFGSIKSCFGSAKNILFMAFVIIFLVWHYLSLGSVENMFDNISLLFPGTALDQVASYGAYDGTLDISSFFVEPENYLRTVIISSISGLFLHMGCTTKAPGAKVSIPVKLLYTLLITLFSSIVLGMIPADLFNITIPEISWEFIPGEIVTDGSDVQVILAELLEWGGILLSKLAECIPTIVAFYFLAQAISGFGAAFLGGFVAVFAAAVVCPEVLADQDSFRSKFMLICILVLGEVAAMIFSDFVNAGAEGWAEENREILSIYNIVSLLIAYFSYPLLVTGVLCLLSLLINGFDLALLLLAPLCLGAFSLATFVGFKITQLTVRGGDRIEGGFFATAMVVNIPLWIIYFVLFGM